MQSLTNSQLHSCIMDKLILKFLWKCKGTRRVKKRKKKKRIKKGVKTNLKESKIEGLTLSDFNTYYKVIGINTVWYYCEFWHTINGTELRVRKQPSILKEINPKYSLEGLMLKLKLQYFVHLIQRTDSFEKPLVLGKIEAGGEGDDRGWDGWMASLTLWMWVWASSGSWWWTGKAGVLQSVGSKRVGHDEQLNWIETNPHI